MNGNAPNGAEGNWDGFGTRNALRTCAAKCQDQQALFAAMDFQQCFCGNEYSSAGRAANSECMVNIAEAHCTWGGADSCANPATHPEVEQAGCAVMDICSIQLTEKWSNWVPVGADGSVECEAAGFSSDPAPGQRKECQCSTSGDGAPVRSTH